MKIKPQNLLRLFLLIPYLGWGISLALLALLSLIPDPAANNSYIGIIGGIIGFYALGIFLWGIPYTILAVGLVVWSLRKPLNAIYKVFLFSPLFLCALMAIEAALVSFPVQETAPGTALIDFFSFSLFLAGCALVFGYIFVGFGILLYKAFNRLHWMEVEPEPAPPLM
jgi:hypothetical protein